jgi:hypothetical protein
MERLRGPDSVWIELGHDRFARAEDLQILADMCQ